MNIPNFNPKFIPSRYMDSRKMDSRNSSVWMDILKQRPLSVDTNTAKTRRFTSIRSIGLAFVLLPIFGAPGLLGQTATGIAALRKGFQNPPADARILMRWWWFGAAVTHAELARELETMQRGGIGGVEIQPVYPLELDDPQTGFRNLPFASPEYLDALSYAAAKGRALGMRVALTLGSGWPYGGSYVPVTEASGRLRVVKVNLSDSAGSIAVPSFGNGEKLLAAFLASGTAESFDTKNCRRLSSISDGRLQLPSRPKGPHVALFFIASRTGQQVKRPAVGADGFVLDHFSQAAVEDHLRTVGEPLLKAFGDHPPSSVFSDSLEVYGADWTSDLLEQFRERRGYDLTPHLPALAVDAGPETADVRYDWARTLTELIDERYLATIAEWAHQHHTQFRSQTYGKPAVTLSSNARVDLPEGEGSQWRSFSMTRWATSASHVYGRPITSTETWTWLHSPPFRATPLDMKAEADKFFLQGSNKLVGHGWPYSPQSAGEPGWSFYAAAALNDHNPWWIVMPDITRYLQRMSYLLRQGTPANDIAVLLPEEDAQSRFSTKEDSVSDQMKALLDPDLVPQILDAGYNFDFIDSEAILRRGIHYPVLVVPGMERLPLRAYQRIAEYARGGGGIVIATGRLPSVAPGLIEDPRDSTQVREISRQLFGQANARTVHLTSTAELGGTLRKLLRPDVAMMPVTPDVGFIHLKLADGDAYFLANTGNRTQATTVTFRAGGRYAEWWDPFTGKETPVGATRTIRLQLAPYESHVLVFTHVAPTASLQPSTARGAQTYQRVQPVDLTHDWDVAFAGIAAPVHMATLHSWTDDAATKFYSGTATYTRSVRLTSAFLRAGDAVWMDFAPGTPVAPTTLHEPGTRAWLVGPVAVAAQVYVNGKLAGSVWKPPYRLDLKPLLAPGNNELKIVVANTAINRLAGRSPADYRLLNSRYGARFTPQDMDNLQPLPSGILGPLRLVPAIGRGQLDGTE